VKLGSAKARYLQRYVLLGPDDSDDYDDEFIDDELS
jgi:hypothetical protein